MSTPLSLRRNFAWTLAGNLVYALSQWGIWVSLARLGTPQMVGQFALALAVTAPVLMFSNLQLRAVLTTDARGEHAFGEYLGLRLLTTVFALTLILPIGCATASDARGIGLILLIGLAKAFEALSDLLYGLFQRREEMSRIARSLMLRASSLLLFLAVLLLGGELVWAAGTLAVVWLAVLLLHDLPAARELLGHSPTDALAPIFNRDRLGKLVRQSLPLGIVMMLISLNTNVPRYFIAHHLGDAELGIFAAIASLILAGQHVTGALGQAASPVLAGYHAAADARSFRHLLLRLLLLAFAIGTIGVVGALLAGPALLHLLFGSAYSAQASLFVALMLAGALSYLASVLGIGMTAARRFGAQLPLFCAVTLTLSLACLALVPRYGLRGAAWSLTIAAAIELSGSALVVGHALGHSER